MLFSRICFSTIITPFTATLELEDGLIPQIAALFFAEILTVSAIQLVDPMGHINRHFLAPRAQTQDAMNLKFIGAEYELAERYTDMTKVSDPQRIVRYDCSTNSRLLERFCFFVFGTVLFSQQLFFFAQWPCSSNILWIGSV